MSSNKPNRTRSKDRFEARYSSMRIAKKGQDEIYNVMLERLSKAIEKGEVTMDDNSRLTQSEQAHILLQKATSRLMSKQHHVQQQGQGHGSGAKKAAVPGARTKATQALSTPKRISRQQAADWAKRNPTGMPSSSAMISPRDHNTRTPDHTRRRYDPDDGDSSSGGSDDQGDDDSQGSCSEEDEEISDSDDDDNCDESRTKNEINHTRKLLKGAASRLTRDKGNLDVGVNNIIYERLMQELDISDKNEEEGKPRKRSSKRAEAAASLRPTLEKGPDQVSRRAHAADMLTAEKPKEQQPGPSSKPSERRGHALDILKNLQQQQQQQRRDSNPENPLIRMQSANPVLQSPACSIRSSSSRQSAASSLLISPVPSLAGSSQSHVSAGSLSRGSGSGRNNPHHSSLQRKTSSRDQKPAYRNSHHGASTTQSSSHRKHRSRDEAKLEEFLTNTK